MDTAQIYSKPLRCKKKTKKRRRKDVNFTVNTGILLSASLPIFFFFFFFFGGGGGWGGRGEVGWVGGVGLIDLLKELPRSL